MKAIYLKSKRQPVVYGDKKLVESYFDEFYNEKDYGIDELSSFKLNNYSLEVSDEEELIITDDNIIMTRGDHYLVNRGLASLESVCHIILSE